MTLINLPIKDDQGNIVQWNTDTEIDVDIVFNQFKLGDNK